MSDTHGSPEARPTTPQTSSDVFVSYASHDKDLAFSICESLERAGVGCWIAPRNVTPGEFYADAILRALSETRILVLVLTEHAVASPHVLREIERTSAKRHAIVSFRVGSVALPPALEYFLSASHWLETDAAGINGALPKLLEAVQRLVAPTSLAAVGSADPAARTAAELFPQAPLGTKAVRRLMRPAVAVSVVVVLGLAYFPVKQLWLSRQGTSGQPAVAVPPATISAAPAISEKSVAVLPFVDMSEKKDQEYFSDGLSEELIDVLSKITELRVPARTSSFYFKGKQTTIREVATALSVAHVLEGSVRKSGNTIRITAQLTRVDNGYVLWSETYDRRLDDIFKVQDEIAGAVVKHLKISLLSAAPKASATDPRAFALFLQARELGRLHTPKGYEQSVKLYQQTLAIDPAYARAWVGLAYDYRRQANNGMRPLDEGYRLAREALGKALTIDPDIAPAHAELGRIALDYDRDLNAAARHLEHALSREPSNSDAIGYSAILADTLGRLDIGIALNQFASSRDPLSPSLHYNLGLESRYSGRMDQSIAEFRAVLAQSPADTGARYHIGEALLQKGEPEAALAEIKQEQFEAWRLIGLSLAYHSLGRTSDADAALAELVAKHSTDWAYSIALVYAWRGEADQAFAYLERAAAQNDPGLSDTAMESLFTNIHKDPRWLPFLRKINLAPEQLASIRFDVKPPSR